MNVRVHNDAIELVLPAEFCPALGQHHPGCPRLAGRRICPSARRIAISALALVACRSFAQTDKDIEAPLELKRMSLEELFAMEVSTVSRTDSTVGESPAAIFVITPEMIRRSGATTIPELFRMVPGMDVARIDGNKWAVSAPDPAVPNEIAEYFSLDARLAWQPRNNLEIAVVGQNLLDPQHPESGTSTSIRSPVVEIQRSVYAKVTWTF